MEEVPTLSVHGGATTSILAGTRHPDHCGGRDLAHGVQGRLCSVVLPLTLDNGFSRKSRLPELQQGFPPEPANRPPRCCPRAAGGLCLRPLYGEPTPAQEALGGGAASAEETRKGPQPRPPDPKLSVGFRTRPLRDGGGKPSGGTQQGSL